MTKSSLQEYLENVSNLGALTLNNLQRTGKLIGSFKQISVDEITEETDEAAASCVFISVHSVHCILAC